MKFIAVIFSLCCLVFTGQTQDTISIIKQDVRKFNGFEQSLMYNTVEKVLTLSIKDKKAVHLIQIDSNYQLTDQFSEKREWIENIQDKKHFEEIIATRTNVFYSRPFYLLACISLEKKNDYASIFIKNDYKALYFQKVSFTEKRSSYINSWIADDKETIIKQFALKNDFYWITYSTKTDSYKLFKINGGLNISETTLGCLTQYNKNKHPFSIETADKQPSNSSSINASQKVKLFFFNDTIFITDDSNKDGATIVHSIDAITLKYLDSRVFVANTDGAKIIKSNSFIFPNKLIQSSLTENKFHITISNMDTKKSIASYTFAKNDAIDINDSTKPYFFENNDADKATIETSRKNIWDESQGEKIFVHAFNNKNGVEITTGLTSLNKDYITPILFAGLNAYLNFTPIYSYKPIFGSYYYMSNVIIPNPFPNNVSTHRLFYKFSYSDSTLTANPPDEEIKYSKVEEHFFKKRRSSIIHVFAEERRRVYLCYSDKMDSYLFIAFKAD